MKRLAWSLAVGYVVALNAALIMLCWRTQHVHENTFAERTEHLLVRADPFVPEGATVFLGDSITQGLATAALADRAANFGVGTLTSTQLRAYIGELPSIRRARLVALEIGTNDLLEGRRAGLEQRLAAIAGQIPDDRPLVWSGILPSPRASRTDLVAVNHAIAALCAHRRHCTYVDTSTVTGFLPDGVHPSRDGYSQWIALLHPVVR